MPVNKNALLRYRIIDACLTNNLRAFPNIYFIQQKLEEQLDVSVAIPTIHKDMQQMRQIYQAPIAFDNYKKGYHYTEKGFSINKFPLTQTEMQALGYSVALLNQLKGTQLFTQFQNAITKITEGYWYQKLAQNNENELNFLQIEEPLNYLPLQYWQICLEAIINLQTLQLSYQSFQQNVSKNYLVSPYLLKEYRNRWYLIAYSHLKKQVITLALDRVQAIQPGTEAYFYDTQFNAQAFFQYSIGITQVHTQTPQTVVLLFTPHQAAYIISQPLHASQQVKHTDRGVEVTLTVYLTVELKMAILGYGNQVKVLQPPELVNDIKATINQMQEQYLS